MDENLMIIINEGISSLFNSSGKLLTREFWSEQQKNRYQLNARVRHILIGALSEEELIKVISITSLKEM